MRCLSCNRNLSDFESTRKSAETGEYIDLCNVCFDTSDLPSMNIIVRPDLMKENSIEQDDGYIGDEEGDKYYDDYEG